MKQYDERTLGEEQAEIERDRSIMY